MTSTLAKPDTSRERIAELFDLAQDILRRARARGADQCELSLSESRGLNVAVRMGEVETVEFTRDRGLALTVYFRDGAAGLRKASASSADLSSSGLEATIDQACAIARYTEADPLAGLADAERMAARIDDFDRWHPWAIDADAAVALGIACETAGREADPRISNSEGASVNSSESLAVYANSHGFVGGERGTSHSIACSLIAGRGDGMQRDDWYTLGLASTDLESPEAVGRRAAERVLRRLDPRRAPTGSFPVLFSAEQARGLIGNLLGAVSGGAQYRESSFLLGAAGQRIFPDWFALRERPHLTRGLRSSSYDAEGVATAESNLVTGGTLQRYLLDAYSARKLGLRSTGNAGGVFNLEASLGHDDLPTLLHGMGRGLYVTELMGQGVNPVTGDYSRGAAGFWVENGEIAYPVDEITIAGNLRQMYLALEAVGSEIDPRSHVRTGPMLIGAMTVAGAMADPGG
ncbi:MAG: metalloprotease PmbA [Proteobacteria bacterium]|nr:metalloprotease PmbA [Pseudomonadota bacterium]